MIISPYLKKKKKKEPTKKISKHHKAYWQKVWDASDLELQEQNHSVLILLWRT